MTSFTFPRRSYVSGHIDDYAALDEQRICHPVPKPGVVGFRTIILTRFPDTVDRGITRPCGSRGTSEHKEGRAWDWGIAADSQRHAVDAVLNQLLEADACGNEHAMARRFGIMYMIWDNRIWGAYAAAEGWRTYFGPDPHTDHVHFSFSWSGALRRTSWWTG
ncbi:hypothetical protein [Actinosynnema sp. ALI-1.44]|uniref:hypothetical protein n=1 Tax=Actinosynnema sp. ALI-1.44 TaxID=1933779 RepID=UPI00143D9AA5|nr:hypothetical protein [Actinosynnema sp. ALI-1.44]